MVVNSLGRQKNKERAHYTQAMDLYILEIGQMIKRMDMAKLSLQMKRHMMETGRMI